MGFIPQKRECEPVRWWIQKGKVITFMSNKKYWSTGQVAEVLGVSKRTVTLGANKWKESGGAEGIPGFKPLGTWRFDPDDIRAWLEQKRCCTEMSATDAQKDKNHPNSEKTVKMA